MRSYWFWLLVLGASWAAGLVQLTIGTGELPWRILGSALFFGLFFLSPLLRKNPLAAPLNLAGMTVLAILVFWPAQEETLNPYPLLVFTIIAGKAVYRLSARGAAGIGALLLIGILFHGIIGQSGFARKTSIMKNIRIIRG